MFIENFSPNIRILIARKIHWAHSDADAAPRKFHALSFRVKGNAHYIVHEPQDPSQPAAPAKKPNHLHTHDGDILFVPAHVGYHIKGDDETLYVIHFEMNNLTQQQLEVFHTPDYYQAKNLFQTCYEIWDQKSPGYYYKAMSILFQILELLQISTIDRTSDPDYRKIKPAVEYLHSNYKSPDIDIPTLCKAAGMSDTYLRKLFLQYFGTTPIKYINRLRINHAKELISSDYYAIEEIAADAGFEDPKYFSSVFRKLEGCSPMEYKKSWWKR